jgi:hypothetical protein
VLARTRAIRFCNEFAVPYTFAVFIVRRCAAWTTMHR